MDASQEDGSLGTLVNDCHKKPNCKMKIVVNSNRPHLCLFSINNILPEEEFMGKEGISCVVLVFDRYDHQHSVKDYERQRRGTIQTSRRTHITGQAMVPNYKKIPEDQRRVKDMTLNFLWT